MKRILSMCSTWMRPDSLQRMVESFVWSEAPEAELHVYVSDDDPKLPEYEALAMEKFKDMKNVSMTIGPHRYMVEVLNFYSTEKYPEFEYYQEVNDDHVYRTKRWDLEFIGALSQTKGTGLVCGNDLFGGGENGHWERWEHPSAAMISGNIVRALGCFTLRGLRQFGGDIYSKALMKSAGLMFHLPNVVIEHMSVCAGKAKDDDRQKFVYSGDEREVARKILSEWRTHQALRQVNLCRSLAGLPPVNSVLELDYI